MKYKFTGKAAVIIYDGEKPVEVKPGQEVELINVPDDLKHKLERLGEKTVKKKEVGSSDSSR